MGCTEFYPGNILKIPAGKHLMDLVAVDWFKDSKRIDHVARRPGCAAQVRFLKTVLHLCGFFLSLIRNVIFMNVM